TERVTAAVEAERERQVNARGQGNNANEVVCCCHTSRACLDVVELPGCDDGIRSC
ncbi:hypothetical protein Tco_0433914, partial [Tanacetum coccineum]